MPVNLRELTQHLSNLRSFMDEQSSAGNLNRRIVGSSLSASLRLLAETALPLDKSTVDINSKHNGELTMALHAESENRTLRQKRFKQYQTIERLMTGLEGVNYSAWEHLSGKDQQTLSRVHQAHADLANTIQEVVEADLAPVRFHTWAESDSGRKAYARSVVEARDEALGVSAMREMATRESHRQFISEFYNYMAGQFPSNQPDESRPTLTGRETLIHAHQIAEALQSQNEGESSTVTGQKVAEALVGGQNTLRYNLPAIEGIATPQFWEEQINNGFEELNQAPGYNGYLKFTLQDRLPADEVIRSLTENLNGWEMNAVNPVVHYLDMTSTEDMSKLANLGKPGTDNDILVLGNENDDPVVVTAINPNLTETLTARLDNVLVVTAPDKRHQIVPVKESVSEDKSVRAKKRANLVTSVAEKLEHRESPKAVQEQLSDIHRRWIDLNSRIDTQRNESVHDQLTQMMSELKEIAKSIVSPALITDTRSAHLGNAKNLVRLALLIDPENGKLDKWNFRTPDDFNTRSQDHPPGVIITAEEYLPDERSNLYFARLNDHGDLLDKTVTLKDISSPARYRIAAHAAERINPQNPSLGRENPSSKGYTTLMLSDDKKTVPTGHWVHPGEYRKLTEHSAQGLYYNDGKGKPLFLDDQTTRSDAEVTRLMESAVYLIHGSLMEPESAMFAAETASFDGDYLLKVDPEDVVGSPKIQVSESVFRTASLEDIKRHMIQKIAMSELSRPNTRSMRDQIETMPWDKAEQGMDAVFEELELNQNSASPGM